MQVFKFGGASVKDAKGVRNVATVLKTTGPKQKVVIISAMGKTTNKLETIISLYFDKSEDFSVAISELKNDHYEILDKLFEDRSHPVYTKTNYFLMKCRFFLIEISPQITTLFTIKW